MDVLEYKGFRGSVRFAGDDRVFHGRLLGIDDVITFEGTTVDELEEAFRGSVEDYLAFCKEIGKEPERAYSGRIPLRIEPELHRDIARAAQSADTSINRWIAGELERAAGRPRARRTNGRDRKRETHP
jgi:predicted HicB family RNase H-like nuclease